MSCAKCELLAHLGPCDECYHRIGPAPSPSAAPERCGLYEERGVGRATIAPAAPEPSPPAGWFADEEWPGKPKPAAPELPEGWKWHRHPHAGEPYAVHMHDVELTIEGFRALLATQGLTVVDAKDRAVLEASGNVGQRWLESYVTIIVPTQADPQAFAWAQAELARREK